MSVSSGRRRDHDHRVYSGNFTGYHHTRHRCSRLLGATMRTFVLSAAAVILLNPFYLGAAEPSATERGQKMLDQYLRLQTKRIADACLADVQTKEDWEKKRPELRRQFLEMVGLWPLPPRTDLKATI